MKGLTPTTEFYKQLRRSRNMLKRTYALGLLAAATLGCFSPLQPMQVKLRSISKLPRKMPQLLVMAIPFSKTLTKAATRTNWITQVQVITIPACNTPAANLNQDAKQNGAAVGTGNVFKTLTNTFRSNSAFNYKVPRFSQVLSVSSYCFKTDFFKRGTFSL